VIIAVNTVHILYNFFVWVLVFPRGDKLEKSAEKIFKVVRRLVLNGLFLLLIFNLIQVAIAVSHENFSDSSTQVVWIVACVVIWIDNLLFGMTALLMGYVERHAPSSSSNPKPAMWVPMVLSLLWQVAENMALVLYGIWRIFQCLQNVEVLLINGRLEVNIGFEIYTLCSRISYLVYLGMLLAGITRSFPRKDTNAQSTNPYKVVHATSEPNVWNMGKDTRFESLFVEKPVEAPPQEEN
jgi:hypothetical protein